MRNRSVGLGSYNFDSHYVARLIGRTGNASADTVVKEGRVKVTTQQTQGPSPTGSLGYGCVSFGGNARCVAGLGAGAVVGNGSDAACSGKCSALAPNEWLTVRALSKYSADNKTLIVTLPAGQSGSWLKKSEALAATLPAALKRATTQGERIALSGGGPSDALDATYAFVSLAADAVDADAATEEGRCGVCMVAPFTMPYDTMLPQLREASNN